MEKKVSLELQKIYGFLSQKEEKFLYEKAKKVSGRGCILEIGSWFGKSTICLAMGSKHGSGVKVYAVDPHKGTYMHRKRGVISSLEVFLNNVKRFGVEEIVVPVVKTSKEASIGWKEPIELIFIDGSHDYNDVRDDLLIWSRYLVHGGIIALHDTTHFEGPIKVVRKYLCGSYFRKMGKVESITFAEKWENLSIVDVVLNKAKYSVYFVLIRKIPIKIRKQLKSLFNKLAKRK